MRNNTVISIVVVLVVLVFACSGYLKAERYKSCIQVGNTPSYCKLEAAGCYDPPRRRW